MLCKIQINTIGYFEKTLRFSRSQLKISSQCLKGKVENLENFTVKIFRVPRISDSRGNHKLFSNGI